MDTDDSFTKGDFFNTKFTKLTKEEKSFGYKPFVKLCVLCVGLNIAFIATALSQDYSLSQRALRLPPSLSAMAGQAARDGLIAFIGTGIASHG